MTWYRVWLTAAGQVLYLTSDRRHARGLVRFFRRHGWTARFERDR